MQELSNALQIAAAHPRANEFCSKIAEAGQKLSTHADKLQFTLMMGASLLPGGTVDMSLQQQLPEGFDTNIAGMVANQTCITGQASSGAGSGYNYNSTPDFTNNQAVVTSTRSSDQSLYTIAVACSAEMPRPSTPSGREVSIDDSPLAKGIAVLLASGLAVAVWKLRNGIRRADEIIDDEVAEGRERERMTKGEEEIGAYDPTQTSTGEEGSFTINQDTFW